MDTLTIDFMLWGLSQISWLGGACLVALVVAIYLEDN